jgi:hypothetical protein
VRIALLRYFEENAELGFLEPLLLGRLVGPLLANRLLRAGNCFWNASLRSARVP